MLVAVAVLVAVALAVAWPKGAADNDVLSLRKAADLPISALGPGHLHQGDSHEGQLHATVGASAAGSPACDKDVDVAGSLAGLTFVAAQNNGICSSADIDVYEQDGEFYVVQAGGRDAAFTITHIAADGTPTLITQKTWQEANTWTPDVRTFKQGDRHYIALSLQRLSSINSTCGSVVVDVSDAPNTTIVDQVTGSDWCDVHNSFVESDANGDGRYLYITANAPNDMRVLDIGDLSNISEIGRYIHPDAGSGIYVHDVTVVDHGGTIGRRVYVSYWNAGLMILDAANVTPGVIEAGSPNQPLNPDYSIRPAGFRTHHAYPSEDGARVFIQDEFLQNAGAEPIQMWDISSPAAPSYVDGVSLGSALMPVVSPAHNLLVQGNRLYVGWYRAGLQAFDFASAGFLDRPIYHQVQTEADDDAWDGAWGVRLATIGTSTYVIQSDRRYGLIVDATLDSLDGDGDGVVDASDNCTNVPNASQANADSDQWGDACDNCPAAPNPNQTNTDATLAAAGWHLGAGSPPPVMTGDPQGDACDLDDDDDFFTDAEEQRLYGSTGFAAEQLVPCLSPSNPDPWPLDVSPAGSPDQGVDTGDVLLVLGFVGLFTGSPGFDPRLDISLPAGGIDTTEVLFILGFVGFSCQTP